MRILSILALTAASMSAVSIASTSASALPKRLFGCTAGQIKSTSCDVGGVTVQDGKVYSKVLYCDSGGHTLCCLTNDQNKIVDGTCETVTLTRIPPLDRAPPRPKGAEQTPKRNPNGVMTAPGLFEQTNGLPGAQGPTATGSPPARSSAPSFQ